MLPITDPALHKFRIMLIDAAYDGNIVETGALETICNDQGLSIILRELRSFNGLAFSFTRVDANATVARRDLAMAIEALASRRELDAALAAATARLSDDVDEDGLAEQMRLMTARRDADQKLAALVQGDENAG